MTKDDLKTQKHLKGVREAIDFDWFVQFVIDCYIFLQEDRENQLRDLFQVFEQQGTLSLARFEDLVKVFHYKSSKYVRKLFEEYASEGKGLNLEQFTQLSLDRELFSPKVQAAIIKVKVRRLGLIRILASGERVLAP